MSYHHHHHRDICNAPITVKKTDTSATYATLKYIKIDKKIRTTVARPNEHYMLD